MKRLLLFVVFTSVAFAQKGPGGIATNLQAWFDASVASSITKDGSNNVSQWNDLSGNSNNATQSTGSLQPVFNSNFINGFPAMYASSTAYFSLPNSSIFTTDFNTLTIITAVKTPSSAGYRAIFGGGLNGNHPQVGFDGSMKQNWYKLGDTQSTNALSSDASYVVTYKADNPTVSFRQNGNDNGSGSPGSWAVGGTTRYLMGDPADTEGLQGYLAEVAIYFRALNSAEINVIENYLGNKYALTLANDKYSGNDASYIYDIIGIGKESDGTASPAQNGGLVLSDVSSLANTDYFLAGHDNASGLSAADLTGGDAVKRWTRIWYIDKTSVSSTGNIKIAFDLSDAGFSGAPATASNYRFLKRSGTSGNFSNITLVGASIVNTDQVEFTVAATNIVDGYYTLGTTNEGTSLLPVEMVSLRASSQGNAVELKWVTATEVNNYGFEVEKTSMINDQSTINNDQWRKIGFVAGAGSSNAPREYLFTDNSLRGGAYSYRLKQIDRNGNFKYTEAVTVEILVPRELTLAQNYPNPFNPSTTIEFTLPEDGKVSLRVYDAVGREVATLINDDLKAGVWQRVTLDASKFSTGVYFSRLDFNRKQLVRRMLMVK